MPRGDGTGPRGMGPMTGRGAGYCAGFSAPGFMNPVGGRMGLGLGRGRAFRPYTAWRPGGFGQMGYLPSRSYYGYGAPNANYPGYPPYYGQAAPYAGHPSYPPYYGQGAPCYGYFPRVW